MKTRANILWEIAILFCCALVATTGRAEWRYAYVDGVGHTVSDGNWTLGLARDNNGIKNAAGDIVGYYYLNTIAATPTDLMDIDMSTLSGDLESVGNGSYDPRCALKKFFVSCGEKGVTSIRFNDNLVMVQGGDSYTAPSTLTNIVFGSGIEIVDYKFMINAACLESVSGLENLKKIGYSAFDGCSNLKSIDPYLPSGLYSIGNNAFSGCTSLTGNLVYRCEDYKNVNVPVGCPATITFHDAITNITTFGLNKDKLVGIGCFPAALQAFSNINDAQQLAGTLDFSSCASLTSIVNVGNCSKVQEVVLPPRVMSIGASAFSGCTALTNVSYVAEKRFRNEMAAANGSVGNSAFKNCKNLASIVLPWGGVTAVGTGSFASCSALRRLKLNGRPPTVSTAYGLFYKVDSNTSNPPDNYKVVVYASPKKGRAEWQAYATRAPTDVECGRSDYPGAEVFGVYVSDGNGNGGRTEWLAWEDDIWGNPPGLAIIIR